MKKFIEYEFACSMRHRRFFTILVFTVIDQNEEPLYSLVKELIAEGDCYVQIDSTFTILYSEKDKEDVLEIVSRQITDNHLDSGFEYTLVGYPQDGATLSILMEHMRDNNLLQANIA